MGYDDEIKDISRYVENLKTALEEPPEKKPWLCRIGLHKFSMRMVINESEVYGLCSRCKDSILISKPKPNPEAERE